VGFFSQSFYADVFNLRSFDLSPGLGLLPPLPLFSLILLYVSQRRSLTPIKPPLTHWFSLKIHIKGREKRAQTHLHLYNTVFEQCARSMEMDLQVNPRSRLAYCAVFLKKIDHGLLAVRNIAEIAI
jgi:hypothetical protein